MNNGQQYIDKIAVRRLPNGETQTGRVIGFIDAPQVTINLGSANVDCPIEQCTFHDVPPIIPDEVFELLAEWSRTTDIRQRILWDQIKRWIVEHNDMPVLGGSSNA